MHLAQLLVRKMRINLRRRNIRVTEKGLDRADVGAIHQKVGCKAVSELVRMDFARDARFFRAGGDEALDGAGRDGADDLARFINAHE